MPARKKITQSASDPTPPASQVIDAGTTPYSHFAPFTLWQQNAVLDLPANTFFDEEDSFALDPRNIRDPERFREWKGRRVVADFLRGWCRTMLRKSSGEGRKSYRIAYTWAVKQIVFQALHDCRMLDLLGWQQGVPSGYLDNLQLCSPGALKLIHPLAYMKAQLLSKTLNEALLSNNDPGKVVQAEVSLNSFRAAMLDGWSVEQVLKMNEEHIAAMAAAGNKHFFKALSGLLVEHDLPAQRDTSAWILRAWLPLGLGDCPPNGILAYERFLKAADTLQIKFPRNRDAWKTAWTNVRNRDLNPRHSKAATL